MGIFIFHTDFAIALIGGDLSEMRGEGRVNLLWPGFLVLLGLIPILIGVYVWMLRRRRRFTVRYSSLQLIREALPRYSRVRRHLPFAFFVAALATLVIALVRPVTVLSVPTDQTTILLAIDVSRSMCSTDIDPSRILAAENAALNFIHNQKPGTQIGIVAFSGFAEIVQAPTTDTAALEAAIASLATGFRTAIGSGLLKSIDAIAEVDGSVAPSVQDGSSAAEPQPVIKGAYAPDIIVLLTDGASNTGPLPLAAAQQAVDRGIRVYTIGFGTEKGSEFPNCAQQFQGSEPFQGRRPPGGGNPGGGNGGFRGGNGGSGFGGGGFGGGQFRRGIDEETLKQIANLTGGAYYPATSAGALQDIFQNLPVNLIVKHETSEVSVAFAGLGALLATLAVGLSLRWQPFP
jgi:Ca-activated chloride channel family protein